MGATGAVESANFDDEADLLRSLRARDPNAFAWLLDRYDASLRRAARRYVSSDAVADDVVGETWLGVIKGLDRFEGRSSLKTWIYRILMNIARTRGVRESRSVPFASLGGSGDDEPSVDPDRFSRDGHWLAMPPDWESQPEDRALAAEALGIVRSAIETLPPSQREVITLRDLEGWSAEDVCNALDLSETNQRVLLHRARAKVRRAVEARLGKEGS
jgi:RNA polymerase sigma-70 factor (ECF subfamily)